MNRGVKLIDNPNLPYSKCKYIVMSCEKADIVNEIKRLGIKIISTTSSNELPYHERFHADMQIHNCEYKFYLIKNNCSEIGEKIKKIKPTAEIRVLEKQRENRYPYNISLNGAFIGDYYICNKTFSNRDLLLWYINNGIEIIDVNQGYSKCSTAIVNHNAVITDDEAIFDACNKKSNIDVLKVSKGSIKLNGYNYGFIGGSCFKYDKNNLLFFGNANFHSDYENIKSFCDNYGIDIISLSNEPLTDLGGAVIISLF